MIERDMAQANLILKLEVGSNLYGTTTPNSDRDYVGVFIPDENYVLGTKKCEQVEIRTNPSSSGKQNSKSDVDTVIYALPKYFHLLTQNNPNIIETLFVPKKNRAHEADLGTEILRHHQLFVSRQVKHTFLGYAFSQRKALTHKRERYQVLSEALNHLDDLTKQGVEVLGDSLVLVSKLREDGRWGQYEKGQPVALVRRLISEEIDAYGNRLLNIQKFGFDTKFASNLIRLMDEGLQLLAEGTLTFPLPNNTLVRDIKLGKFTLDEVLAMSLHKEGLMEQAYLGSTLRSSPDTDQIEKLQVKLLKDFWQWTSPSVGTV